MIRKSVRLTVLALALSACSASPVASSEGLAVASTAGAASSTSTCSAVSSVDYIVTVTAEVPAGEGRVPALSWEDRPEHAPTATTLQRTIRACDATSLSVGFRSAEGSFMPIRPLAITSETLDSSAGPIRVVSPADNKSLCEEDVDGASTGGSCAQPLGWYLILVDPKLGTFELCAPVDFGDGVEPSTVTINGTVALT
ncbi:hypothetical protein ACFQ46_13820 [Kineococcus sp. GCM10028916]|uniref:hypothetical protein n=1 Tax=Kineococcus sp. GCM10028916 TaxID=3273394 RepID=UPI00362DAB9C